MQYLTDALETLKQDIEHHTARKFGKVEITFYAIRGIAPNYHAQNMHPRPTSWAEFIARGGGQ